MIGAGGRTEGRGFWRTQGGRQREGGDERWGREKVHRWGERRLVEGKWDDRRIWLSGGKACKHKRREWKKRERVEGKWERSMRTRIILYGDMQVIRKLLNYFSPSSSFPSLEIHPFKYFHYITLHYFGRCFCQEQELSVIKKLPPAQTNSSDHVVWKVCLSEARLRVWIIKCRQKLHVLLLFCYFFFGAEVWWQMVDSGEEGVAVIQAEDHKCLGEHCGRLPS